jgi:hypothetical protein
MPLEGHWARQHTPFRGLPRRERRVLAVAGGALLALVVALAVHAALQSPAAPSRRGCVEIVAASTTGGATFRACGTAAARWCANADRLGGADGRRLRERCVDAGYRVAPRR